MIPRFVIFILLGLTATPVARADDRALDLNANEGTYGMINRPWPDESQATPVTLTVTWKKTNAAKVRLGARDIFGQPIPWTQTVAFPASTNGVQSQEVAFPGHGGFYAISAECRDCSPAVSTILELGVIPPFHPGIRPDSFFASNTSGLRTGADLALLQAIGMKVERAHFNPDVTFTEAQWKAPSSGKALPLDFSKLDQAWTETKSAGLWGFPVAAYGFSPAFGRTDLAFKLGMWGPPRNDDEFVNTWEEILRHYPEITTYEFWNEPWIYGWTWAGTPEDYRKLQKAWCEMALRVNPKLRIVAGNSSMFVRDNISPFPECWQGLLQGTSHHPYAAVNDGSYRTGENFRSIDLLLPDRGRDVLHPSPGPGMGGHHATSGRNRGAQSRLHHGGTKEISRSAGAGQGRRGAQGEARENAGAER
jgi:hypothetical protein